MDNTVSFQNYKTNKEDDLLNSLDFINNTYVWSRCEHCGELVILRKDGYVKY